MNDRPDRNAKPLIKNLVEQNGWWVLQIRAANRAKRGVPDAIVAGKRKMHFLEIKAPKGVLSAEQIAFINDVPFGACVHVATSSFEANLLLVECEARR